MSTEIDNFTIVETLAGRLANLRSDWDEATTPKSIAVAYAKFAGYAEAAPGADYLHWEAEHATPAELDRDVIGFPFFDYNDEPVTATKEDRP